MTRPAAVLPRMLALLAGLLLAQGAPAARSQAAADSVPDRLVIVTFERRAAKSLAPGYGSFLREQRLTVGRLLRERPDLRLQAGDVVAVFADGADPYFARSTGVEGNPAGVRRTARALSAMLSLPGREPGPDFWLWRVRGAAADSVDEAIRRHVTCPLVGRAAECADEAGGLPLATLGFSRPLLTFPVQYSLVRDSLQRLGTPPPPEVMWIWVQVGERINEVNSAAKEIGRDFQPPGAADAVTEYWEEALRTYDFSFEGTGGPRGSVGSEATVWRISGKRLDMRVADAASAPVRVYAPGAEERVGLPAHQAWSPSLFDPWPRLMESTALAVAVTPLAAGRDAPRLVLVRGQATCTWRRNATTVALPFVLRADSLAATLAPAGRAAFGALVRRCAPDGHFGARLARERERDTTTAQLVTEIETRLRPGGASPLPVPPTRHTLRVTRLYSQHLLSRREWIEAGLLAALALLGVGVLGWTLYWLQTPVRLGARVVIPSSGGSPKAPRTVLQLGEAPAGPYGVELVRLAGPPRRVSCVVSVRTHAFSEIPVRAGQDPADVVQLAEPKGRSATFTWKGHLWSRRVRVGEVALAAAPAVVDLAALRGAGSDVGMQGAVELGLAIRRAGNGRFQAVPGDPVYLGFALQVLRARPADPQLGLLPANNLRYRGIFLGHAGAERQDERFGVVRVTHRAGEASRRPDAIALRLRVEGSLRDMEGRGSFEAFFRNQQGDRVQEVVIEDLDTTEHDVEIYYASYQHPATGEPPVRGEAEVKVQGWWRSRAGEEVERAVQTASLAVPWYPVPFLYGISVDLGTSATRVAMVDARRRYREIVFLGMPRTLPLAPGASATAGPPEAGLGKDLGSACQVRGARLVAAGEWSPQAEISSLKAELMRDLPSPYLWDWVEQFLGALATVVEGARESPEPFAYGFGQGWDDAAPEAAQRLTLHPSGYRYVLVVTVPDGLDPERLERFAASFGAWRGKLEVVVLREAEAVVFDALARTRERIPERILVVDVGAGTVDYAAARTVYSADDVSEVRIEGLAVSRAAGDAYSHAAWRFWRGKEDLGKGTQQAWDARKRRFFTDPAVPSAVPPPAGHLPEFRDSEHFQAYFHQALDVPLRNLAARLQGRTGWEDLCFQRVILSGRGSLAFGWRDELHARLVREGLVAADAGLEVVVWAGTLSGSEAYRADRLKGAVATGALGMLCLEDRRISPSESFLRDHLVLLERVGQRRYAGRTLLAAGLPVPPEGILVEISIPDADRAALVYSSHVVGDGSERTAPADELWERMEERDGAATPEVRLACEVPPDRPSDRLQVRVLRSGTCMLEWA
ncbi:hypothetical protein [Longimicrobium sp.]|uniref:hypothetical protein n=1 Tax=Longimicrobium sp. TaxID=2029185 RepID=UPI003B3A2AA8